MDETMPYYSVMYVPKGGEPEYTLPTKDIESATKTFDDVLKGKPAVTWLMRYLPNGQSEVVQEVLQ